MTEKQHHKKTTFRFLKGNLTEAEETKLLESIKSGEYPEAEFLADQDELAAEVIQPGNKIVDDAWLKFKKNMEASKSSSKRNVLRFNRSEWIAVAAAFVVGILLTSAFFNLYFSEFHDEINVQQVSVPFGAKSKLELPDGSIVWLNSGTKISYPEKYKGKREVTLEGEGFFEVVKSKIPFVVKTQKGDVEVLGTSFNVQSYSHEGFQTTLVTGSVMFTAVNGETVILKPGEQAAVSEAGNLSLNRVDTDIYTSWKEGKLIFYREPFAMMAKRLERWYNVKIIIGDDKLKELWFTGTVEMETLSEFMALLERTYTVRSFYYQKNRTLRLEKK